MRMGGRVIRLCRRTRTQELEEGRLLEVVDMSMSLRGCRRSDGEGVAATEHRWSRFVLSCCRSAYAVVHCTEEHSESACRVLMIAPCVEERVARMMSQSAMK
jgi:hypothetical protein